MLCIDEFQVTDVADAIILTQFFGEIWRRGVVVVVTTSNSHPSKLYEGGGGEQGVLPTVHRHVGEILRGSSLGWGRRL